MPSHLREMLPSASQISISTPIVKHHQNATKFMLAEALVRHNWPLIYNHIDLSLEKNTEQRIQHFLLHWEVQQLPMYNFSSHPTPPNSPTSVHMLVRDEIQVYVIHLDMEKPLPYFFCLPFMRFQLHRIKVSKPTQSYPRPIPVSFVMCCPANKNDNYLVEYIVSHSS